jgi:hypothetical protein
VLLHNSQHIRHQCLEEIMIKASPRRAALMLAAVLMSLTFVVSAWPSQVSANASVTPQYWAWDSSWVSNAACQEARTDLNYRGIFYSRTECVYNNLPPKPWQLNIWY